MKLNLVPSVMEQFDEEIDASCRSFSRHSIYPDQLLVENPLDAQPDLCSYTFCWSASLAWCISWIREKNPLPCKRTLRLNQNNTSDGNNGWRAVLGLPRFRSVRYARVPASVVSSGVKHCQRVGAGSPHHSGVVPQLGAIFFPLVHELQRLVFLGLAAQIERPSLHYVHVTGRHGDLGPVCEYRQRWFGYYCRLNSPPRWWCTWRIVFIVIGLTRVRFGL